MNINESIDCLINKCKECDVKIVNVFHSCITVEQKLMAIKIILAMLCKTQVELANEFKELKEYVDNYFKNLDVTSIITEILENMQEDGTLENIITNVMNTIYTDNTGNVIINNLTAQMIYSTAMSYYMNAWTTVNPDITYGNAVGRTDGKGTALDENVSDYSLMDCSTFVLLSLLGINYAESPYNGKALPTGRLGFKRNFIKTNNNDTGLIRWAYEILLYAYYNKCLYEYNEDLSDVRTGDIVFFCWTDKYVESQPSGWWGENNYEHCAHVGICVQNCDMFPSGVGILQAVSTSALTNFVDLKEYAGKLTNQYMYPKIMRPNFGIDNIYLNGLFRFRGDINPLPLVLNHSAINYAGGKMPTNMTYNMVDKTSGKLTPSNERYTTFYIPYSISMFINNAPSTCGYNYCYYTENKEWLGYSQNVFQKTDLCAYVRIEFYNRNDGDLTSEQIGQILNTNLTYHTWCDNPQSFINQIDADIKYKDTIFYFEQNTNAISSIIANGI